MWKKTLSGLRTINADVITGITYSGVFIDNMENYILSITGNVINNYNNQQNQITNLNISSNVININLENYNSSLTITGSNINTDLQNTKSLIGISHTNLIQTDQLLQNEIDAIVLAVSYAGSVDALYGISIAQLDSNERILQRDIGTTFNSLGSTQTLNNQQFQNFKSLTETNIITLNNLAITSDSRLDILESDVYNLNITSALHELRLDNNDIDIININSDINDLQSFCYGTTASFSSTGVEWTETVIETLQDVVEYTGYIVDGVNLSLWARDFYHQVQETSLWTAINAHIANYNGYILLQESTDAVQTTNIGLNTVGLGIATADILSLNIATALLSVSCNNIDEKIAVLETVDNIMGVSINTNLDNKLNSFIIGTTTSLNSINSSLTNIGTTFNSHNTRITNYENRIIIDTIGITFKGQTINSVFINDVGMGISGILTVSGTLQSPLTSLLSVSSGIIDGKVGTIIGVSLPQFLTRNETTLPSSFVSMGNNSANMIFNLSDNVLFNSGNANSYHQFKNTAMPSNGLLGWVSNSFEIRNPSSSGTFTYKQNGNNIFTIDNSNNSTFSNNLTISGTLQSPLTNLLNVSHSNLSSYVYSLNNSALGVSINNETTRTNNLTTSQSNTNSQLYSFNSTLITADTNLGTSISNVNSKASTIIGVSLPQILSRNETLLPSTFISSNLNKLGTSAVIGKSTMKQNFDFQVGSDNTTLSNPENTSACISGSGENTKAILYLGTPNNQTSDSSSEAMKCALMAQGLSNYSRSKFHICMNNQIGNDSSLNAKVEDSVLSINMDGALTVSGTALYQSNLTISGTLQSPLTSLISVSSGILDGKIGILGISHSNLSNYTYSLNNSALGVSINNNSIAIQDNTDLINTNNISLLSEINNVDNYYDTQVNNLGTSISNTDGRVGTIIGVSIPNIDSKVGTLIGISIPQFLTKNQTVLPSTFTSSSLTSLGTLSRLGLNKTNTSGNINLMIKGLTSGAGSVLLCPNIDNTENSIYFHPSSQATGYDSGATGSWLIGSNINGGDSNSFSVWNPNLQLKQMRMKIGGDTEIYKTGIINSQAENTHSYLYLSNSNGADSALKTMIMSEAQSSWSRGKLHFCLNNDATTNSTTKNATLADSRMSLDYNSNLSVSGNVSIGNNNNTYKLDVSGDSRLRGNLIVDSALSVGSLASDTNVYNSGGNTNFKIQANTAIFRIEQQTSGDVHFWNSSNEDIFYFTNDKQVWFRNSVNSTSLYYTNGVPVSSSRRLKKEIKDIEDNNIFDKLKFKQYLKNIQGEDHFEYGVLAEEVKELDPENKYGLWIEKENQDGEMMDYIFYTKIFCLGMNEMKKMKNEINELKEEINNLKNKNNIKIL